MKRKTERQQIVWFIQGRKGSNAVGVQGQVPGTG